MIIQTEDLHGLPPSLQSSNRYIAVSFSISYYSYVLIQRSIVSWVSIFQEHLRIYKLSSYSLVYKMIHRTEEFKCIYGVTEWFRLSTWKKHCQKDEYYVPIHKYVPNGGPLLWMFPTWILCKFLAFSYIQNFQPISPFLIYCQNMNYVCYLHFADTNIFHQFLGNLRYIHFVPFQGNWDSAVGIATGYGLEDRGGPSSSASRIKNFLFSTSSRPALGPTQLPM
jgi:hypothetical protein